MATSEKEFQRFQDRIKRYRNCKHNFVKTKYAVNSGLFAECEICGLFLKYEKQTVEDAIQAKESEFWMMGD